MPALTPKEALGSFQKAFRPGAPYREYTKADDDRLSSAPLYSRCHMPASGLQSHCRSNVKVSG